jgi:hypothetical protein
MATFKPSLAPSRHNRSISSVLKRTDVHETKRWGLGRVSTEPSHSPRSVSESERCRARTSCLGPAFDPVPLASRPVHAHSVKFDDFARVSLVPSIDETRTEQLVAGQGLLPVKHGLSGNIRRTEIGTSFLRDCGCLPLESTASNRLFGPVRRCVRFEHWYLDTERSGGVADDITRAQCPDGRARPDPLRASRLFAYYPCRRSG